MRNLNLECVPSWRFCNIPRGQKGPRSAGWQKNPIELRDIDDDGNIGVLLGPASSGLCALDFDGPTAWTWFDQTFGIKLPDTIAWASGKPGRCQMAFSVPEPYWPWLKTLKIATGEREGFELRWTGGQSVLPPSLHPDTGQEYFWVYEPQHTDLAELPDAILAYWLGASNPVIPKSDPEQELPEVTEQDVIDTYTELKRCYPELDYDRWSRATWIVTRQLGVNDGLAVMRYLYAEKEPGEYQNLLKGGNPNKPATMGSIVAWIRERNPDFRKRRTTEDLKSNIQSSIQQLKGKMNQWQQKTQKN
jgi:hypothetical protein